jgi:uncharacterized protein YkwD
MMHKRRLGVVLFSLVIIVSLAGQAAVSAQPGVHMSRSGYALGAYDPDEQAANLSYLEATPQVTSAPSAVESFAEDVVQLINQERRAAGLYPFKVNPILTTIAEQHSVVLRDQGCFDHQCSGEPSSAQRACNAGYRPYGWGECYIGETIAGGYSNPDSVVSAWMQSPGHRDILMHGKLREIGVGYVSGGYYGHYWTADFGSQPDVLPVFINYDDPETKTREVTLTLDNEEVSGNDGIDYAHDVMISNDPDFAGAEWQLYTLHKAWTLTPGNGQKTVYVKYRDPRGDMVVSVDDILLNIPAEYQLALNSNAFLFFYEIGKGFTNSATANVEVTNAASSSPMSWEANAEVPEEWLQLVPSGGTTPDELAISVQGFTTDEPGTHQMIITVTSPQAPDASETVTLTVVATENVYRVMLPIVTR